MTGPSTQQRHDPESAVERPSRQGWNRAGTGLAGLAVLGVSAWGFNLLTQQPDGPAAVAIDASALEVVGRPVRGRVAASPEEGPAFIAPRAPLDESQRLREKVVGRWTLHDKIKRVIDMRPDGSATMHVKLDLVSSLLYGPEMTLQLTWRIDDGILHHTVTNGEPKNKVDRLIRDFGDSRHYRIVEVSDQELLLESFDKARTRHRWVGTPDLSAARLGPGG